MSIEIIVRKPVERTEKGNSLIEIPTDYTVIDIETTGFDLICNDIIEVAAVRVRGGVVVDKYSSLIKPPKRYYGNDDEFYYYVDSHITELTGISDEMLEGAPEAAEVLTEFVKFIGDDILVAHHANFDINFLYENMMRVIDLPLRNDFIDTMRISRRLFPESEHHRSCDLAANCGVPYENAHRALGDCLIAGACFEKMREIVANTYESFDVFSRKFKHKGGRSQKLDASEIVTENVEFDEDHPFYQRTVVFTGTLTGILRRDAMQSVVDVGGYVADGVTKKTNYLVIGSFDFSNPVKGGKSAKMKKAEKMKLDGFDIEVISENTFLEFLENK